MPPAVSSVVLVVDDAPDTLRMLCDALAIEGYTVLVARDAIEALERFEMAVPDAVLLDAIMPGENGFALCRRLKSEPSWAHVPVIFMTGLAETEQIVEGFASGGVDYVVKPLKIPEVLGTLGHPPAQCACQPAGSRGGGCGRTRCSVARQPGSHRLAFAAGHALAGRSAGPAGRCDAAKGPAAAGCHHSGRDANPAAQRQPVAGPIPEADRSGRDHDPVAPGRSPQ